MATEMNYAETAKWIAALRSQRRIVNIGVYCKYIMLLNVRLFLDCSSDEAYASLR